MLDDAARYDAARYDAARYDAVVVAGGRSRRLGGVPKAALHVGGRTLLTVALSAASAARRRIVVGPRPAGELPAGVTVVREQPPFAGPAAAVGAGLDVLAADADHADWVLVLACDMPRAADVVQALAAARVTGPSATVDDGVDGVIAKDATGHLQPLAGIYRHAALADAVREHRRRDGLEGAAVFGLVRGLSLSAVEVPAGATDDVDTWDDARRLGAREAVTAAATARHRTEHT